MRKWQNVTFLEIEFLKKFGKNKNYRKVSDYFHHTSKYRDAEHSICNLIFNIPNKIPVVFRSLSNYDYHCIIKELAKKIE